MSKRSKALRYYRSYRPEGPLKKTLNFILRLLLGVFILYQLFTAFAFQSYSSNLPDMKNAHFIATPFLSGPEIRLINYRFPSLKDPERGDLVLVETGKGRDLPWYALAVNSVTRFFTLNRFTAFSDESVYFGTRLQLMRVLGIPGDSVKLEEFRVRIRPEGQNAFLDEFGLIKKEYVLDLPVQGDRTDRSLPFSGNQPVLSLDEGEYLLLPDDRSGAASSGGWTVRKEEQVMSRVLFAYWPRLKFF